jgi:hypothetical protein
MGRPKAKGDAPEQVADVERELKALEERAEYCSRTARFYFAAHRTLADEAVRLRAALGGQPAEAEARPRTR